ncbi:MAG: DUF456 family protein [Alkalinema sp. FL-bin-369]|nr:DUF456 family protein [Leptolyngbyaceae cyanobacterium LF-bin-369]
MWLTVLYGILVVVMLVGIVGAVVPGLPGPSLILGAIVVWCLATKFAVPLGFFAVIFGVLILSAAVEWLGGYLGAKQVGASSWSQWGMMGGMAVGFFGLLPALPVGGPIVGLFLVGLLGGFIGEFLYRSDLAIPERLKMAGKVSLAIGLGSVVGNLVEGVLAVVAVAMFIWSTWGSVVWG